MQQPRMSHLPSDWELVGSGLQRRIRSPTKSDSAAASGAYFSASNLSACAGMITACNAAGALMAAVSAGACISVTQHDRSEC